jgi:hypothetical protein
VPTVLTTPLLISRPLPKTASIVLIELRSQSAFKPV